MANITCGNCKLTHSSVEQVRNCYAIQAQDPTSVTPSQAAAAQRHSEEDAVFARIAANEARAEAAERAPQERYDAARRYAENETASKLIDAAAEKRAAKGVRFAPTEPMFESEEEQAAAHAKFDRILGGARVQTSKPRVVVASKTAAPAPVAVGNRNAEGMTIPGFYKVGAIVWKVTPARTSNRTFGHQLKVVEGAPEFEYRGLASRFVPADAPKLTLEDAKEFGHTHGYCMICGRLLTAEDSVAAGIGPICAGKL